MALVEQRVSGVLLDSFLASETICWTVYYIGEQDCNAFIAMGGFYDSVLKHLLVVEFLFDISIEVADARDAE
jgi:hypothetical protein